MISLPRKSNLQEDKNINEKKEYLSEQKLESFPLWIPQIGGWY
jgi:hypothetical protein